MVYIMTIWAFYLVLCGEKMYEEKNNTFNNQNMMELTDRQIISVLCLVVQYHVCIIKNTDFF